MIRTEYIEQVEDKILLLEAQVKHLTNELTLTKEEYEISINNYYDIFSNMEQKVEKRTTDLKRLQNVLEEKGRELQIMLDSAPGMIFYKDAQQKYVRVNKQFVKTLKVPMNQVIGRTHAEIFPEGKEQILNDDLEVYGNGETVLNKPGIIETARGRMPVMIDRIPYKDVDEKVIGIIGYVTDLTEIEKTEKEKNELRERIARAEKMESIGTLAGGIAHDFNNLLFAVQGNVSLMLLKCDETLYYYEKLKRIEDLVQSGADLTRQLLGFARGGKYEVKQTNLNQVVKKISTMFGRTKKELKTHEEYDEKLWKAEVNKGQIEQAMLNILVNAAQAMPSGGDLYIKTENALLDKQFVEPNDLKPGKYVKLSVKDTGIGMDDATLQRIFEPFFTTKEMGRGTGLGLASAYGIIKNHNGIINVTSKKDRGTTFNIYLPVSKNGGKEKGKEIEVKLLKGSETILFIDDEKTIRNVGGEMLHEIGYNVIPASSGKEGIAIYKKNRENIDMIILDMIMPEMGGERTYKLLKEINTNIKVLLSSGYSIKGQATEILEKGCNGFIQKPFNMKKLSQAIRKILDKK
ncbi:MAG: response regulator [Thermodesulfobacteriota bacterium]|nr:response regulator [Thermodesulfobacteriota bacterium]